MRTIKKPKVVFSSPLVSGRAISGPRDGAKITAHLSWNGLVMRTTGKNQQAYKGRYRWNGKNWMWKAE